ncbi:hypothetical protein ABTY59_33665 [Streptomyces sp. NPDC096079]|uniref:hypothetical protein n=1 Tax=Streptomyces sp. NPDC096079 TaxID=3155820 RepID=UPI0033222BCA
MASATRTRRPKMTDEERAAYNAEQRAKLSSITDGVYTVLHTPDVWRAMLVLTARLDLSRVAAGQPEDRSPVNVLAILGQLPTATDVRGASDWRKVGRYPAKGSTSLRVWGPVKGRRRAEETAGTQAQAAAEASAAPEATTDRVRVRAYAASPTFDVSQTDGDDYTPEARPAVDPMACARRLAAALAAPVTFEDTWTGPGALRVMLDAHAAARFQGLETVAGQNAAEAASAAHLAALILGFDPRMAPAPQLGGMVTGARMTPAIKDSAVRVIETGRALAALATG